MNRSTFLRNLIATFGLSVIPVDWIKQYQKIYLLQCFVRGFRFYNGEAVLHAMKVGDLLELVREPENRHDHAAIALHYNMEKIGYIPRESNEILSRLMDANVIELQAEITHIEQEAKAWENVHIAIYVLKELIETLEETGYLIELTTPKYYTIKHADNTLSRVYHQNVGKRIYTGEDFYGDMVAYSKDDGVYDLLHNGMDAYKLDEAVEAGRFVTNKKNLPKGFDPQEVLQEMDEIILDLDDYFAEDGLVMLNVEKIAKMPDRIIKFVDIVDKKGNRFIEVLFKAQS